MILWKRQFHNICIDKMKALFPIKKEYVKKIFDGSKAYEYRKSFCSLEVDTIVIYESRGKGLVVGEFEIIETFTEHQQLLRHIMVAEYKDEYCKKQEEAYMEGKLKHIFARSTACI